MSRFCGGSRVINAGWSLVVNSMRSRALAMLALTLCGCSGPAGPMFRTEPVQSSASISPDPRQDSRLRERLPASGQVPADQLLRLLAETQMVKGWPAGLMQGASVECNSVSRVIDAIRYLEDSQGWVYDPESLVFTRATATHSLDGPDAFGRPQSLARVDRSARGVVCISLRFVRCSAGLSLTELDASATLTSFKASFPDGVQGSWSSTTERTYFNNYASPVNQSGNSLVQSQLQTRSAGLTVNALAARLPHGMARIDGTVEVSSFTGAGLDKATVDFPLQLDCPRHEWARVVVIRGADLNASAAFKHWSQSALSADADDLALLVKLD